MKLKTLLLINSDSPTTMQGYPIHIHSSDGDASSEISVPLRPVTDAALLKADSLQSKWKVCEPKGLH